MSLRKHAVSETATLHLQDAEGNPIYADEDEKKPVEIILYGPGSKEFAEAQQRRQDAMMSKIQRGSRTKKLSQEEAEKLRVDFLVRCTAGSNNLELDGQTGTELYRAVYSDRSLGFIADQVDRFMGDWGNFSPSAATS